MLKWALIFAVVAFIAGALGFGGVAGAAAVIAKLLFLVAVIGFLVFVALGVFAGKKLSGGLEFCWHQASSCGFVKPAAALASCAPGCAPAMFCAVKQ